MPARKRKSGGAEVTSGFDRHRVISSDEQSSEEVDSPKTSKIIEDKVAQMKESNEENLRMQMRLDEAEKRMEKAEKMAQSEREKTAKLTTEMKSCIKNFYPTSWKDKAEYGHKNIDSWDYSKIRNVMSVSIFFNLKLFQKTRNFSELLSKCVFLVLNGPKVCNCSIFNGNNYFRTNRGLPCTFLFSDEIVPNFKTKLYS